jgi:ABC-type bacteriocin/lantibiotic exporter with double-glycine peptidase domain
MKLLLGKGRFRYTVLIRSFVMSFGFLVWCCDAAASERTSFSRGNWRAAEYSGLNCLYLWAASHRLPVDYDNLAKRLAEHHQPGGLVALRDVAKDSGFFADIRSLTPEELQKVSLPAIALCDDVTGDGAGFVLVLKAADTAVLLVDGGSSIFYQTTNEHFRRRWTGYTLILSPAPPQSRMRSFIGLASVAVFATYFLVRFRRKRKQVVETAM